MVTRKAQEGQHGYTWRGNQHGSWMAFGDQALKDLDMTFGVQREIGVFPYLVSIHWGAFLRVNHGYPDTKIAKKYCEEYLAAELQGDSAR